MIPSKPDNEVQRLTRLQELGVHDTAAEPAFDALTRTARLVTGAPIALISLVDENRQWFKSNQGLAEARETPRDLAFCAHAILVDDVMVVPDASRDPRFADNPLVTGKPGIRFYAGAPITLRDGLCMGTLCVIDRQARELTDQQRKILVELAHAAAEILQMRQQAVLVEIASAKQQEAERKMAAEHRRLSNVIKATQAGTFECNLISGKADCNDRWAEIIGYQVDELVPLSMKTWLDHAHPEDWVRATERFKRHLRGESPGFDCDLRMRHKEGHWIWVRYLAQVTSWDSAGKPLNLSGLHVDINDRKVAEMRLRANEVTLERVGRLAGVGGWEVDLDTNAITWSDQTCRIHEVPLGYQPAFEEAINFYTPESRPTIEAAVARAIADGTPWDLELQLVTAKGRQIWVRSLGGVEYDDGQPRWLMGAFQETTLRKRAVQAMEISERRFRKLFQYSLGLICTHDLDGTVLSFNPAAARELGYSVQEAMGRRLTEMIPSNQHEQFEGYLRQIREAGSVSGTVQLLARDKTLHTWQFHNVLDNEDDEPYIIGHAQDITKHKQLERQLRELTIRDPLTGCFNRRYLHELELQMKKGDRWGCIGIDLDRFKQVNDTLGHQRGDEVLIEMGKFLFKHARAGDIVVRMGGDEFLVLLRDADGALTQQIAEKIAADHDAAPNAFSIGHAVRKDGISLDEAVAQADKRLYATRASNRS
ncbi:MAG TPA: PAS domain S-box protein [Dokdonella sp.]|uniref:PAS domain S-box protein n=1 Tax=Dokdonella sp. TaxID=2291710 RepID=UPI002D7E2512|nr:PAS domain S-box protein [Dokdonella sp.]HET9032368.1 PAS domain S-box protein [Dokdonella sp.]